MAPVVLPVRAGFLISRRTVRSQRSMGIPGPISTVHDELMSRELAELA